MNAAKTAFLLGILSALFLLVGQLIGGQTGLIVAFLFAVVFNFGSYWFSDKLVLKMYRATEVGPEHRLYRITKPLAQRAGLPMPRVYEIPNDAPNAFATGRNRNHAAVAATAGIMRLLDDEELAGVMAHELAHVENRDILIGSIAATVAAAIMMLASMARWAAIFGGFSRDERGGSPLVLIATAIVAPLAAMVIQAAISRQREFAADRDGARIAGHGRGLATALQKLEAATKRTPLPVSPATQHLFIVKPFSGRKALALFSTHPPTEERVRRLAEIS